MKRDKRWLLFIAAIIGIVGCADALKATSLIFGRVPGYANKTATATTSTTSTTTAATVETVPITGDEAAKKDDAEPVEDEVTKPPLTGIPQIDYIWDPNLPRELNGFNLSSYPFLGLVPDNDEIDFKCDGLHDGFYASIKYSCQLYHHCIYGIRHDFLCANFTAFDQKTFICQFVSEVNCKNSPKYWFRNDALYKATTTTSTTTTTQAPPPTTSQAPEPKRRPGPRRPLRRRRPQHDYYYEDDDYADDYVEERMNRRRKPIRNRNRRPEYDDYDNPPRAYKNDEDYSYEQRPLHRERTKTRDSADDDGYDYDRRTYERPRNRKRPVDTKRHYDDDRRVEETDDRRPYNEGRKHAESEQREPNDRRAPLSDDRKPYNGEKTQISEDRRSLSDEKRTQVDVKRPAASVDRRPLSDERRSLSDDRRPLSDERKGSVDEVRRPYHDKRRPSTDRRPYYDDDYEEIKKPENTRDEDFDDRPIKRPVHGSKPEIVPKVRSSSPTSSIFNRPRAPPKINRPVPINEKKKFEYTPQNPEKTPTAASEEEVYEDEYDYELEPAIPQTEPKQVRVSDEKRSSPVSSSQREQRPPHRVELKEERPQTYSNDDLDLEKFDARSKVTSIKPQRSTLPKIETIPQQQQQQQQQLRTAKPEIIESRFRDTVSKDSHKPLTGNPEYKDEFVEDSELPEYIDDDESDVEQASIADVQQPDKSPVRNDYRTNFRTQHRENNNTPDHLTSHRHNVDDAGSIKGQSDRTNIETNQYRTQFHRLTPPSSLRTLNDNSHKTNIEPEDRDVYTTILSKEIIATIREPTGFKPVGYNHEPVHESEIDSQQNNRPYVRIMKRPFLPSRGGSPYLPRGLKPVGSGIANAEYSIETTSQTTSTASSSSFSSSSPSSGIHLFEHNLPIIRPNFNSAYAPPISLQQQSQPLQSPQSIPSDLRTTTPPPQIEPPRSPLDEIFNSDYDVTINDALNPTLKPLTQSHESPIGFSLSKYDRSNPYARSDVSHSPSQYRSTAIQPPVHVQSRQSNVSPPSQQIQHQQRQSTARQQYYEDEYEY